VSGSAGETFCLIGGRVLAVLACGITSRSYDRGTNDTSGGSIASSCDQSASTSEVSGSAGEALCLIGGRVLAVLASGITATGHCLVAGS
jgi:hypothetical protein